MIVRHRPMPEASLGQCRPAQRERARTRRRQRPATTIYKIVSFIDWCLCVCVSKCVTVAAHGSLYKMLESAIEQPRND